MTSSNSISTGSLTSDAGDRDPLLLAAGELVRVRGRPGPAARPGRASPAPAPRPARGAAPCTLRGARVTLSSTRQVREEVERLEDDAHPRADGVGVDPGVGDVAALELDHPVVDRLQQVDAAQQGRLARAGGADQHDDLVRRDVQVEPVQDDVRRPNALRSARRTAQQRRVRRPVGARGHRWPPRDGVAVPAGHGVGEPGQRDRQQHEQQPGDHVRGVVRRAGPARSARTGWRRAGSRAPRSARSP